MAHRRGALGRRPLRRHGRATRWIFSISCSGRSSRSSASPDNQAGAYRPEDIVTASYRFASGVYGSGAWCYAADREEEYNEIVGANGRIRFSTTKPVPIRVMRDDAVEEIPVDDPPHVHQPLIETIVAELNGRGTCPSTGESGARTTRVVDEVLREYRAAASPAIGRGRND